MMISPITIIIATYNREGVLCNTLEGLKKLDPMPREILVVDQTLTHTREVEEYLDLADLAGEIQLIRTDVPSLPRARNLGVCHAKGSIVLFLDDDAFVPVNLIGEHQELYQNEAVSAVCGQVYQPSLYIDGMEDEVDQSVLSEFNKLPFGVRTTVNILRGCHFSVRKKDYISIGGFDEAFVGAANGEESDFANRLRLAGRQIIFDPSCFIVHWKIPTGGCRIAGNSTIPEWKKTASMLLYGLRYFSSPDARRYYLLASFRSGPLRRENIVRWWRFPGAVCAYLYAFFYALRFCWKAPTNTAKKFLECDAKAMGKRK